MHKGARILVAIAIFGALTATSMVAAGFTEDGPPEGSPETYATAESLPGDRGVYKTALVVVDGDGKGHYTDMNARFAFERLPDEVMLGPGGDLTAVQDFVSEWETGQFEFFMPDVFQPPATPAVPTMPQMPQCTYGSEEQCEQEWEEWEEEYEESWEEWEHQYEQAWEEWEVGIEAWMDAFNAPVHTARASDWHVTHHDGNATVASTYRQGARLFAQTQTSSLTDGPSGSAGASALDGLPSGLTITEPMALSGPCGWKHSLQGSEQDMWDPVIMHGACPPDMELDFGDVASLAGPLELRVSGRDTVQGDSALVFSLPEDPDLLRVWLTEENPYPVRVLTRIPDAFPPGFAEVYELDRDPSMYVLHELVEFERGAPAEPLAVPATPRDMGQRSVTGPDPSDFEHVWPLRAAWQAALDAPTECQELQDHVADHPQTQLIRASFTYRETDDPDHEAPIIDEIWTIITTDGEDALATALHRHTETEVEASDVPVVGEPEPVRRTNITCDATATVPSNGLPSPGDLPRSMPSLAHGQQVLTRLGGETTGYGFDTVLADQSYDMLLIVGTDPGQYEAESDKVDLLLIGDDSGFRGRLQSHPPYPEPRFSDSSWSPHNAGSAWRWSPAGAGVWHMPEPVTAGGLAAGAAVVGVLYLLWPVLKGAASAAPLFTRIRKEDLLEHPVRSQIHELVQAEPGLHFQEIVRRMEKGRGTMEHHIRKLVAGEILVEKPERGFTCYFPRGQLDRRLMTAAPALKSAGAKQVLNAVLEQPGTPAKEVAEKLGMAASTVNYHVKRLVDAGLVEQTRQGRTMALTGTGLGEQAHGRFGRT